MEVPPKVPEQGSRAPEGLLQLPVTPFNNTNKMDFGTWGRRRSRARDNFRNPELENPRSRSLTPQALEALPGGPILVPFWDYLIGF